MILSAQTIRRLASQGMISPFSEREIFMGKTYGLGPCTYDLTLGQDVTLASGEFRLATTKEHINLPANICASMLDKSSWARQGLSIFNTHFDPGWRGYPTIELVNLGPYTLHLVSGVPICQMKFEQLDDYTHIPYAGKYQDQPSHPVEAINE